MTGRHVTTGVTLLVLLALLAVGVVVGVRAALTPLPDDSAGSSTTCVATKVAKGQRVSSDQVEVSVYNAGTRAGLADRTLLMLSKRGFNAGDVGNAPGTAKVLRVQVWTTTSNDLAAKLVARQFGPGTRVRVVDTDLGPGVDVLVGNRFQRLSAAKKVLVAARSSSACKAAPTDSP